MDRPYQWQDGCLILSVRVLPRSNSDGYAGIQDNVFKIKLVAPPVDGKANQALINFLAKQFKVSRSSVVIEKGMTSRTKRVRIAHPKNIPDFLENP